MLLPSSQTHDPAAYRMVEREITCIINTYLFQEGEYRRTSRTCFVDFEQYTDTLPTDPHYEWCVTALASLIVH